MRNPTIIRFPPSAPLADASPKTLRERLTADLKHMYETVRGWLRPKSKPKKAPVFQIHNPTQWKLDRARRKARERI